MARFRRTGRRRPLRWTPGAGKFAKRKYTWITAWNSFEECEALHLQQPQDGCWEHAEVVILDQDDLQEEYQDRVTVRRVLGRLDCIFAPDYASVPDPLVFASVLGQFRALARCGLRKGQVTAASPLGLDVDPGDGLDYSDAQFLRILEHGHWPRGDAQVNILAEGAAVGCCSVVTGGASAAVNAATWTTTEGALDTAISTECEPCTADSDAIQGAVVTATAPGPWVWNWDYKRPIKLRENEKLSFHFAYGALGFEGTPPTIQTGMGIMAGVRLLLELA